MLEIAAHRVESRHGREALERPLSHRLTNARVANTLSKPQQNLGAGCRLCVSVVANLNDEKVRQRFRTSFKPMHVVIKVICFMVSWIRFQ